VVGDGVRDRAGRAVRAGLAVSRWCHQIEEPYQPP
jgi:hypothetical protein